jgi:hypothetical protein
VNALRAKDPLIATFKGSVEAPDQLRGTPEQGGFGRSSGRWGWLHVVDLLGAQSREQFVGHTAASSLPTTS